MTAASESLRWAVQVSKWQPTEGQWSVVLQSLPKEVQERCMRFRQLDDQKRAVVSQLLQRACIRIVHGEDWGRIDIQRTKGSKPYYAGAIRNPHAPNFNYNVSHEVRRPWMLACARAMCSSLDAATVLEGRSAYLCRLPVPRSRQSDCCSTVQGFAAAAATVCPASDQTC